MSEFHGYGFAAGSVMGLRAFAVDHLGRLTGVTVKQVWIPGDNTSECRKQDTGYASAWSTLYASLQPYSLSFNTSPIMPGGGELTIQYPQEQLKVDPKPAVVPPHQIATCSCGYYAYFDGGNDYAGRDQLAGVVEAFGKVTIGTRGFRAEKARILALTIPTTPRRSRPDLLRGTNLRPTVLDRVRRNYPGVAVFDSQHQMVAEFPTTDEAITPETDEQFWTRETKR